MSNKLGEVIDVCEEQSRIIADLKWEIEKLKQALIDTDRQMQEYLTKCLNLEHRLSNCIEPKFKVGDKVWYYHIGRNKIYSGVVEDMQWRPVNGMYYRIPNLQRDYFWIRNDELFSTKAEAEKKLEEMKNG